MASMHTLELIHLTSDQMERLKYPSPFFVRMESKHYDEWNAIVGNLMKRHKTPLDVEIELFRYCDCVMQTWQRFNDKPNVGDVDVKVLRYTTEQKAELKAYADECAEDDAQQE